MLVFFSLQSEDIYYLHKQHPGYLLCLAWWDNLGACYRWFCFWSCSSRKTQRHQPRCWNGHDRVCKRRKAKVLRTALTYVIFIFISGRDLLWLHVSALRPNKTLADQKPDHLSDPAAARFWSIYGEGKSVSRDIFWKKSERKMWKLTANPFIYVHVT